MRRLVLLWLGLVGILLALFVAVEHAGMPLLTDPGRQLRRATVLVALLSVSLLVVDAALPVASSAVMLLNGAVFGVVGGTVLSTCGAVGALVLAAWIGRRGLSRMVPGADDDDPRVAELLQRYGTAAIILSRPVPLLAESVAMVAGAAGMPWWRLLAAGTAGIVPLSMVYALAGARSGQAGGAVVAVVVIFLAGAALALSALRHRQPLRSE
jgi:uncharacterized membrane protein YdjX (TVP38/TMEM64 family)